MVRHRFGSKTLSEFFACARRRCIGENTGQSPTGRHGLEHATTPKSGLLIPRTRKSHALFRRVLSVRFRAPPKRTEESVYWTNGVFRRTAKNVIFSQILSNFFKPFFSIFDQKFDMLPIDFYRLPLDGVMVAGKWWKRNRWRLAGWLAGGWLAANIFRYWLGTVTLL